MKNKKRLLAILLTITILAGAAYGIGYAVRKTTSGGTVMVIPADTLNYGWYMGDSSTSVDGTVTTDATQNVYVTASESVAKVYVREGEAVKKGDPLVLFDTEQAAIALAQRELELDQIRLSIDVSERNLETLRRMTPISEEMGDDGDMDGDEDFDEYGEWEGEPYAVLDRNSTAYNEMESAEELGTMLTPARYLIYDDRVVIIRQEFLRQLIAQAQENGKTSYYISLEAHEENNPYAPISNEQKNWIMTDVMLWQKSTKDLIIDFRAQDPSMHEQGSEEVPKEDDPAKQIEELQEQIEALQKQIAEAEEETKTKDSEIEDLKKKIEALEAEDATKEIQDLQAQVDALQEELTTADEESKAKDDKIKQLEERIKELEEEAASGSASEEEAGATATAYGGAASGNTLLMRHLAWTDLRWSPNHSHRLQDDEDGFSISSGPRLISSNAQYTGEEIKQSIASEEENLQSLELDEREASLKLKLEEQAVREGTIYAKMDGVVKSVGEANKAATDGTPLVQITGSKGLFVQGALSETMLETVREGDPVTIQSWQTGMVYAAEITEISPYPSREVFYGYTGVDNSASSYPFLACITDQTAALDQNEYLQISFSEEVAVEETDENALYLYKAFILDENGKKYVYKRGEDGLLVKQELEVGELSGQGWRVLSGVTMQDYVAFPYGKEVKEGAKTREGTIDELYTGG